MSQLFSQPHGSDNPAGHPGEQCLSLGFPSCPSLSWYRRAQSIRRQAVQPRPALSRPHLRAQASDPGAEKEADLTSQICHEKPCLCGASVPAAVGGLRTSCLQLPHFHDRYFEPTRTSFEPTRTSFPGTDLCVRPHLCAKCRPESTNATGALTRQTLNTHKCAELGKGPGGRHADGVLLVLLSHSAVTVRRCQIFWGTVGGLQGVCTIAPS